MAKAVNNPKADSETRRHILRAALKHFANAGYAATSVQAIVDDAKVSKPALYYHFADKAGLFQALVHEAHDQRYRILREAAAASAGIHAQLENILAGRKPKTLPPLDLAGTEFQKSVWNALRKISLGKTKSYGEIAAAIGKPKAVRAVGGACGANPVPVLVPCHRVLAANQKLGGFSGGLDWKRSLLAREGINLPSAG